QQDGLVAPPVAHFGPVLLGRLQRGSLLARHSEWHSLPPLVVEDTVPHQSFRVYSLSRGHCLSLHDRGVSPPDHRRSITYAKCLPPTPLHDPFPHWRSENRSSFLPQHYPGQSK